MSHYLPHHLCKVCQAIEDNPKIKDRIAGSSYYVPSSKDTLTAIHKDHADLFTYSGLKNHARRHQFPNAKEITKAEEKALSGPVPTRDKVNYTKVWDMVIEKGVQQLESGEQAVNVNMLLQAARDQATHDAKSKDQSLALMDMIYKFSSGEIDTPYDQNRTLTSRQAGSGELPAPELADDLSPEPLGPRDFYQSLTGDASARRPGEIPARSDSPQN